MRFITQKLLNYMKYILQGYHVQRITYYFCVVSMTEKIRLFHFQSYIMIYDRDRYKVESQII